MAQRGSELVISYGKVGAATPQSTTKTFADSQSAAAAREKLVRQKQSKGYRFE